MAVLLAGFYIVLQLLGFIAGISFLVWCFRQTTFRSLPWFAAYVILAFITSLLLRVSGMDASTVESSAALVNMIVRRSASSPGIVYLSFAVSLRIFSAGVKLLLLLMLFSDISRIDLALGGRPAGRFTDVLGKLYGKTTLFGAVLLFSQCCQAVLYYLIDYSRHACG